VSRVSVVIPTLNEERRVGLLLHDLRRQTRPPEEVIVVDGGSTDATVDVACRFARVIPFHPPVGAQRQAGLEAATGDWVVFLDADTRVAPDFLERVVTTMERRRLDVACPVYRPDTRRPGIRAAYAFFNAVFALSAPLLPSGGGMCIVARREAALRAGGFRGDLTYEDIEFIRRAARRGRFGMLRCPVTVSARRFERHGAARTFGKYLLLSLFFCLGLFKVANMVRYGFAGYDTDGDEHVVLVDEVDTPIGTAPKSAVHTRETPLHRGFSAFVFDRAGRLLLQQRSAHKVTWPLAWSNTVCGHPAWGESAEEAARRRLEHELGLTGVPLVMALPDYRYRAERDGIVENEFCPVLVGVTDSQPVPNSAEVGATRWVPWKEFVASLRSGGADYSPWCIEEALLLADDPRLPEWLSGLGSVMEPVA